MRNKLLIILAVVTILIPSSIWASNITDATYVGDVVVTNAGGTAASDVATVFDLKSQALRDGLYINEFYTDTAIRTSAGTDLAYMPGIPGVGDGDKWCVYIPAISGNSSQSHSLYTGGNTDMAAKLRYFPGVGGMTFNDHASIEPGGDFRIELSAYINTGSGTSSDILTKPSALRVCTSDKVNGVAAYIPSYTSWISQLISNAVVQAAGANWKAQTFTATGDYLISRVDLSTTQNPAGACTGIVSLRATAAGAPTGPDLAVSVATSVQLAGYTTFTFNCPYPVTNGVTYAIVFAGTSGAGTPALNYQNTNPYAGGQRFNSVDSGASWTAAATDDFSFNIYTSVGWMDTTVTKADHDITIQGDAGIGLLLLGVDSALNSGDEPFIAVPPNANNWTAFPAAANPYAESLLIYQGGALHQQIGWEPDTTFTDMSGNGNDATPSFRTTTSNADVTAALSSYRPVSEAVLTGYSPSDDPNWIGTAPAVPAEMYTEGNFTRLPGAAMINTVLDAGDIPYMLFWLPVLFMSAVVALFGVFLLTRSLMIASLVAISLLFFFGVLGMISIWIGIVLFIIAGAIIVKRETASL